MSKEGSLCPNSGTYASLAERLAADETSHAKCRSCGRFVKLVRDAVIPHHNTVARNARQGGRR